MEHDDMEGIENTNKLPDFLDYSLSGEEEEEEQSANGEGEEDNIDTPVSVEEEDFHLQGTKRKYDFASDFAREFRDRIILTTDTQNTERNEAPQAKHRRTEAQHSQTRRSAPTTPFSFNFGNQISGDRVSVGTQVFQNPPPATQNAERSKGKEKDREKGSEEEIFAERTGRDREDLENKGVLMIFDVTEEDRPNILSWLASLQIPINSKETVIQAGVLLAPFASAIGQDIWEERKIAYKGPGRLPRREEEAPRNARPALVIKAEGGNPGELNIVKLAAGFADEDIKKSVLAADVSILYVPEKDGEIGRCPLYLLELSSMTEVKRILAYPEAVIVGDSYLEFSTHIKSEDKNLIIMCWNIPKHCSRFAVFRLIKKCTGEDAVSVEVKTRADGVKYAFVHTASVRQKEKLLRLGSIEIEKGRSVTFEARKTEEERMQELQKRRKQQEEWKQIRTERNQRAEARKKEREQKRKATEDSVRRAREMQQAREEELRQRNEEIKRTLEGAKKRK